VQYIDCIDEERGLPSLPDKCIDLCFTDPPYNIELTNDSFGNNYEQDITNKIFYNDKITDYFEWCKQWFEELKRICNKIIFTPGSSNLFFWIKYEEPVGLFIHYKRNSISRTSICRFHRYEPILLYGKYRHQLDFYEDVLNIPLEGEDGKYIHPCPKNKRLWKTLIKRIKPLNVLDPFLGSGTTAEVCNELGIPWIGYEINKIYSQDINKRLKNCKREPQQVDVFKFIKNKKERND